MAIKMITEIPANDIPQGLDPSFLDAPVFEGTTKKVIRELGDLYDSPKWEHPEWNRSTQRCWKKQRLTQYK